MRSLFGYVDAHKPGSVDEQSIRRRSFPEGAWHDQTAPRWIGPEVLSDSNRQAATREFGCMQAIVLNADGEPRCISCHGAFGADESQADICSELTRRYAILQQKSGEGGGLVSRYVTCLRHGHTAWFVRHHQPRNLCLHLVPSSCSHDTSFYQSTTKNDRHPIWPVVSVSLDLFLTLGSRVDTKIQSAPCR
jgi:hypothetical protein